MNIKHFAYVTMSSLVTVIYKSTQFTVGGLRRAEDLMNKNSYLAMTLDPTPAVRNASFAE